MLSRFHAPLTQINWLAGVADTSPPIEPIQITQRIGEAGRLLGVTVHDHVIIGREGHVSLRAKGLI